MYRRLIRPILFLFDPEKIHHFVFTLGNIVFRFALGRWLARNVIRGRSPAITTKVRELTMRNPIGLAAGFDKNGILVRGIADLGFGFAEVGTITPRPQLGNPTPRIFRVSDKNAIVNRMGFNNDGADVLHENLRAVRDAIQIPLGINIGKNRDTPVESAISDYDLLLKKFSDLASYFVVNISSPNTPGLRDLQNDSFATELGTRVLKYRLRQPVFIKLSPDVDHNMLKKICALCGPETTETHPFAGLVLTNTIPTDLGGLSGAPLKGPSEHLLKLTRTMIDPGAAVISVGGIQSAEDIWRRFELGASAVQIYTSIIYEGPGLAGRLARDLENLMKKNRVTDLRSFWSSQGR